MQDKYRLYRRSNRAHGMFYAKDRQTGARDMVWINNGFGKGKKCLKLELERIEEELVAALNRRRPPDRQLKTTRQRNKEKRRAAGKPTFAQKLAANGWDGTPETLTEDAERAGYLVHAQTVKSIRGRKHGHPPAHHPQRA